MEGRLWAELAVDAGEREEAISCPAGVGAMMLCRGWHEADMRGLVTTGQLTPGTRGLASERETLVWERRGPDQRAETRAGWPDTLLNTAGIKTWGGFVRTHQRQWGGSQSLPRPITHCLHQRETIKIPWNTHTGRELSPVWEPIGIQESSMKSIWHNDGREAPANTVQGQIVEKGQDSDQGSINTFAEEVTGALCSQHSHQS